MAAAVTMSSAPKPIPTIVPATMLELGEADYCYGVGTLALRVKVISVDLRKVPQLEWLRLIGDQIRHDGTVIKERDVVVRVSALAGAVRDTGWLPKKDS